MRAATPGGVGAGGDPVEVTPPAVDESAASAPHPPPPGRQWFGRAATEVVVIAISILLAFAIDAWWERRGVAVEVESILVGLEDEFATYESELAAGGATWDSIAGEVGALLEAIDGGRTPSEDQIRRSLWGLLWPATYNPGSGVRDAVIASGRLELLESVELRAGLVAWEGVKSEVLDNEAAMQRFLLERMIPYMAATGFPGHAVSPLVPWSGMTPEAERAAYRRLFADPQFFTLASTRYAWMRFSVMEFAEAESFASEMLDRIRRERDRR